MLTISISESLSMAPEAWSNGGTEAETVPWAVPSGAPSAAAAAAGAAGAASLTTTPAALPGSVTPLTTDGWSLPGLVGLGAPWPHGNPVAVYGGLGAQSASQGAVGSKLSSDAAEWHPMSTAAAEPGLETWHFAVSGSEDEESSATTTSRRLGSLLRPEVALAPGLGALPQQKLASPLRVPLPEPVVARPTALSEAALELPAAPSLSSSALPTSKSAAAAPAPVPVGASARAPPPAAAVPPGLIGSGRPSPSPGDPLLVEARGLWHPPGLLGPSLASGTAVAAAAAAALPPKKPAVRDDSPPPGIVVRSGEVDGSLRTQVEWTIDGFRSKLQASMGKPLVSPPFSVRGLTNLRLMVLPDALGAVNKARIRERKTLYASMVKKGPLHGGLKLKADFLDQPTVIRFGASVGSGSAGPARSYDFAQQAIQGPDDLGVDWIKQVDAVTGSVRVNVEIHEVLTSN
eukprot:TRINITY_DN62788_c0_g1_i1.p1 TRINITY_DN62788_c0_g1~~TRINITY_DN62788_c0_g1_i1.p1  ORF type:complete len:460 (-),score=102.71 TRINITY_DN62788_c0_g1_i1:93-1472(-)